MFNRIAKTVATSLMVWGGPAQADIVLDVAAILDIFAIQTTDPQVIADAFSMAAGDAVSVQLLTQYDPSRPTYPASVYIDLLQNGDVFGAVNCIWLRAPASAQSVNPSIAFGDDIATYLTEPFDAGTTQRMSCRYAPFRVTLSQADAIVAQAQAWAAPRLPPAARLDNDVFAQSYVSVSEDNRAQGDPWALWIAVTSGDRWVGAAIATLTDLPGPAPIS